MVKGKIFEEKFKDLRFQDFDLGANMRGDIIREQNSGGGLVGIELKAWIGVLKDKRKEKSESNSIEFKIYEAE